MEIEQNVLKNDNLLDNISLKIDDSKEKCMVTVALRGLTILPRTVIYFDVIRKKSLLAVEEAMQKDQKLLVVAQKNPHNENPVLEDLCEVGTVVSIRQILKVQDKIRIMVEGLHPAKLVSLISCEPYLVANIIEREESMEKPDQILQKTMKRILKERIEIYLALNPKASKELDRIVREEEDIEKILEGIVMNFPLSQALRQNYLETDNIQDKFELLGTAISTEIDILAMKKDLQQHVQSRIDKNQKEYILREQLKVIREELGEEDIAGDGDLYLEKVERLKADREVKDRIRKEISRFKASPGGSQESAVMRTYIETLLEMPWNKASRERIDLKVAQEILDKDHYGLEKVKERVLEYLAVRKLLGNKKGDGSILCLVGPPGTGKTSIAISVARALKKEYVRISLGGVHDEAEIRGHRKTYVGAMPGRIAVGIKQAGVKNPLMLLDEIDKVSSDYKGDTASALLEVLDGEQNSKFRDHYLEVPIDLSDVLFVATANSVQTIPRPLLDRMEVIEVTSYTENEKYHIADQYLVEKQMKKNGLKDGELVIDEDALKKIIRNYTREAGVRGLERKIGDICRKTAKEILESDVKSVHITAENLEKYLGKELISFSDANKEDEVGIVRGLAWTSVGGDTLEIEVNVMPGKGDIKLTGKLGDVMKESAQTALSYIRSIADRYDIKTEFFSEHDIHMHIPEGAVPKDGPSAGITMATAMLSAITNKKIKATVAMTGEITLRGRVLPIGGLKEKILAAKMAHIKTVLVPQKNKPDIAELSDEITGGLDIIYVSAMEEVIANAFAK